MEISPLEPNLSKSNGSSSKQEGVESSLLAGDQGGASHEAPKTSNEKEVEINGRKNHQPSNKKIGGVSSTRCPRQ